MSSSHQPPSLVPDAVYRYSAMPRPVDPRVPSNRLLIVLVIVGALLVGGLRWATGGPIAEALAQALFAALGIFLAWAIGREIDPEHPYSAFLGALLTLVAALLFMPGLIAATAVAFDLTQIDIFALFLVLMVARMVARTVGPPAKPADSIAVLVLLLIVGLRGQGDWLLGLVAALMFLLDFWLPPRHPMQLIFCVLALIASAVGVVLPQITGNQPVDLAAALTAPGGISGWFGLVVLAIAVLFLITIGAKRTERAQPDVPGHPLSVRRVQAAMLLALLAACVTALWGGDAAILHMLPLWATLAGVSVYRLPRNLRGFSQYQRGASDAASG